MTSVVLKSSPKRFRVIVKVLCKECFFLKKNDKSQLFDCHNCRFLRYNNVTNLLMFQKFLDLKYSAWDWWKVYRYVKGEDDNTVLITYKNYHKKYIRNSEGKWNFIGTGRDVPNNKTL